MSIFLGIVIGIFSLLLLITLHELGHFVFAKLSGAYVYEFAIGFGPTIFIIKGKETWFKLKLIPFGGFNYIASKDLDPPKGRENEIVPEERKIESLIYWKRILFILFGPLVNFLIAFLIFTIALPIQKFYPNDASFYGANYSNQSLKLLDESRKENNINVKYKQDLSIIGLRFIGIDDKNQMYLLLSSYYKDKDSDLEITKDKNFICNGTYYNGETTSPTYLTTVNSTINQINIIKDKKFEKEYSSFKIQLIFKQRNTYNNVFTTSDEYKTLLTNDKSDYNLGDKIGIAAPTRFFENSSTAFVFSLKQIWVNSMAVFKALGMILIGKFNNLSGPVGIVKYVSQLKSFTSYLYFIGGISINLFIFNMLIIPPLDGYRIIECIIEKIIKKEISLKWKYFIYGIGAFVILLLMVLSLLVDFFK